MSIEDPADQSYTGLFGELETASGVMVNIRGVEVQLYNPRSVDAIKLRTTGPGQVEKSYRVLLAEGTADAVQEALDPRMIWSADGTDNAWIDVALIESEATLSAPQTQEAQTILDAVKQNIRVMAHLKEGPAVPNIAGYIQTREVA